MWKKILIGLAVVVLIFLGIVAIQPGEFRISRTAVMAAPPDEVFRQVNDFHHWQGWSPWAAMDPDAKATFEGPESGEGAKFGWDGNADVGKGRMTIIESKPDDLIRIRLDFEKPFENTCTAEFNFKPENEGTRVTWNMFGHNNFMGKAICLFMNMDKMVGGEFEKGLQKMKGIVEAKDQMLPAEQPRDDAGSSHTERSDTAK